MGFHAEVKDFQPYYIWNSRKTTELRVGASVLKEALDREIEREERVAHAKREQKALKEIQAKQVMLAYEDDRKRKALYDKLEKERRLAREGLRASQPDVVTFGLSSVPGGDRSSSPPPYREHSE